MPSLASKKAGELAARKARRKLRSLLVFAETPALRRKHDIVSYLIELLRQLDARLALKRLNRRSVHDCYRALGRASLEDQRLDETPFGARFRDFVNEGLDVFRPHVSRRTQPNKSLHTGTPRPSRLLHVQKPRRPAARR